MGSYSGTSGNTSGTTSGGGSTWSSGGGSTANTPSESPKTTCINWAAGDANKMKTCDCMEPKSGTCVGSSASAGGTETESPSSCWAKCTVGMDWTNPAYDGRCRSDCKYWGNSTGGSSSGSPMGGAPTGSYTYWSQELKTNVYVWNKGDCDAKLSGIADATKKSQETQWCYQALSGTPAGGGTSGTYPAAGGGSGDSRCYGDAKGVRYGNAQFKENGIQAPSGLITCTGFDLRPCFKGDTLGGPPVDVSSFAGPPVSCITAASEGYKGGMYGAGTDPVQNCKMGCQTMLAQQKTDECTKNPNPQSWCKQTVAECEAVCSTTAYPSGNQWGTSGNPRESWIMNCMSSNSLSRPQCESKCSVQGSGCPQTGDQWNTGGSRMPCTFDNGKTILCRTPNVDCVTQEGATLSSEQVGKIGPNCRFPGGGNQWSTGGGQEETMECRWPLDCSKIDCTRAFPRPPQRMLRSQCINEGGTVGGGGQGDQWNDGTTDLFYQKSNVQRAIQNLMDQFRQLTNMSQQNRVNIGTKLTTLRSSLENAGTCLQAAGTVQAVNICEAQVRAQEDTVRTLWNEMQAQNNNQQFAEVEKQLQEMQRMITQLDGQKINVSSLKSAYQMVRSAVDEARKLMQDQNATSDQTQMAMQRVYDLLGKFWNEMRTLDRGDDGGNDDGYGDDGSDLTDMCTQLQEEIGRRGGQDAGVATQLGNLVTKCYTTVSQFTGGGTPVDGYAIEQAMRGLWQEFESLMSRAWNQDACMQVKKITAEAESAMQGEAPKMIIAVRKSGNSAAASKLEALLVSGRTIVNNAKGAANCNQALDILSVMEQHVAQPFMAIVQNSGVSMKKFKDAARIVDHRGDYAKLGQDYFADDVQKQKYVTQRLEEKNVNAKELLIMKKLSKESLEQAVKTDDNVNIVAIAADLNIESVQQIQQMLKARDALKLEIAALEATRDGLKQEIASYIVHPMFQAAMSDFMQQVASGKISGKKMEEAFRSTIEGPSQKAYVKDGTVAFEDVRLNDWSAKYANAAKKLGIINGIDGKFAGGRMTNAAEVMKMAAGMLGGDDDGAVTTSTFGDKAPAWAQGAVATVEANGFDPDLTFKNPGDPVTRRQAAVMFAALFPLPRAGEDVFAGYSDLDTLTITEKSAIGGLIAAGIMTGDGKTWNPDGKFTRDQFTKVAVLLMNSVNTGQDDAVNAEAQVSGAAGARTTATHNAAETTAPTLAEPVPEPAPEPVFKLDAVSEKDLLMIQMFVREWQKTHGTLSTDRRVASEIGVLSDLVKSLGQTWSTVFDQHRKDRYPATYIDRLTVDMSVKLPENQQKKMCEILKENKQPMAGC